MECSLMHWYEITGSSGKTSNTVMLGRVNRIHAVSLHAAPSRVYLTRGRRSLSSIQRTL
jgi:hypothetical protein